MHSVEIIVSISNEAPRTILRRRANIRTNKVVDTKKMYLKIITISLPCS